MNKEQFDYWKSLPETQEIFGAIDKEIKMMSEYITGGHTINFDSTERTLVETLGMIARIQGLKSIMEMDSELDFEEGE